VGKAAKGIFAAAAFALAGPSFAAAPDKTPERCRPLLSLDLTVMENACRGILARDPRSCSIEGHGNSCLSLYWQLIESKVLITAPSDPQGAARLCLAMMNQDKELKRHRGIDGRAYCEILVRDADDARARTAALMALLKMPVNDAQGRAMLAAETERQRGVMGLAGPETYRLEKEWEERQDYLAARAYRAAYAEKDPRRCADSGLCRALMGEKDACRIYADCARPRTGDAPVSPPGGGGS
jgi:hypothetical protein